MSEYLNFIHQESINKEYIDSTTDKELIIFGPVKRLNILVGPNNSRKSRFVRKMLNSKQFDWIIPDLLLENLEQLKDTIHSKLKSIPHLANFNITQYKTRTRKTFADDLENIIDNNKVDFTVNSSFLNKMLHEIELYINKLIGRSTIHNDKTPTKEDIKLYETIFSSIIKYTEKSNIPDDLSVMYQNFIKINKSVFNTHKEKIELIQKKLVDIVQADESSESPNKIYIPILRNAIRLLHNNEDTKNEIIEEDIYKITVEEFYKLKDTQEVKDDNKNKLQIFTGLNFYKEIKKARNSRKPVRDNFNAFEAFVSASFFQNRGIDIIALDDDSEETNHIHIYFDGGEDKQLHNLGDGIQALLILIYPIFMAEDESCVFLEEPEINMHPGLLRLFIKTILKNPTITDKKLRFFLTTHSNHLLDLTLEHPEDVSIFSFKPNPEKSTKNSIVQPGIDINILNDLGVSNSSLFMANCSIWVEGPTDRKIIKAFLEAYYHSEGKPKPFLEDLHYCFIQYGGSTIANYVFGEAPEDTDLDDDKINSTFISNKIILIADQDLISSKAIGKQKGHELLKRLAADSRGNFTYYTTKANEIENLLSPSILAQIAKEVLLRGKPSYVEKTLFDYSIYKSEYMGKYLKEVLEDEKHYVFFDGNKLKTDYKNKIADYIVKAVSNEKITWKQIQENLDAAELIKKIHDQITIYNPTH